jgi:predicted nucleotidyltransferase
MGFNMKKLDEIINKLITLKSELHERYAVSRIELFGSYVRGEQQEKSDLDVLVEFDRTIDLLDLVSLEMFISEQLGVKADVVPKRSIRSELRDIILNEAIAV